MKIPQLTHEPEMLHSNGTAYGRLGGLQTFTGNNATAHSICSFFFLDSPVHYFMRYLHHNLANAPAVTFQEAQFIDGQEISEPLSSRWDSILTVTVILMILSKRSFPHNVQTLSLISHSNPIFISSIASWSQAPAGWTSTIDSNVTAMLFKVLSTDWLLPSLSVKTAAWNIQACTRGSASLPTHPWVSHLYHWSYHVFLFTFGIILNLEVSLFHAFLPVSILIML